MKQWNLQRVWPTETRQQSDLNSGISDFHQGRGFLLSPHFQPSHPMNVASLLSPSCHDTLLVFWVPQWRTHGWIYWGVQWRFPFGTTQFPASAQVCASVCERATFTQAWPPSLHLRLWKECRSSESQNAQWGRDCVLKEISPDVVFLYCLCVLSKFPGWILSLKCMKFNLFARLNAAFWSPTAAAAIVRRIFEQQNGANRSSHPGAPEFVLKMQDLTKT